jgi:flagellum-specific ATP synthase
MTEIVPPEELMRIRRFRRLYAAYRRSRDLVNVGAYVTGADPDVDEALRMREGLFAYLRQDVHERSDYRMSTLALSALLAEGGRNG